MRYGARPAGEAGADNSTACSAPRAAQGTFSTSNRQPPPAAYAAEQPAPTELAQLQAVAPRRACAPKGSAHQEAREDDGDGADAVGMEGGNHAEARARKPAKGGPLRHERSHRAAAAGAPGGVEHTLEWTPQGRLWRERYLRTS